MALLEEGVIHGSGMVKELEGSAALLILQNLQQDPYQYPEKSFIRETVSNCTDSLEEKKIAISILTGETKIEDHYAAIESDITNDSKFDPEYYNLEFLDTKDRIDITYIHRYSSNRDQIIIEDTGVGLGGHRLRGFFKPGFSTKRLSIKALGKFGLGSKSGLSTGVEYYTMVSRYNGREYKFNIYMDRFYSIIPRLNEETGNINPCEVWKAKRFSEDGSIEEFDNIIYYNETDEKNGVSIILDIKNPIRNKQKYIDAVKSQLNYFDNVRLFEKWENDTERKEIYFKTDILYKDEHLIIPKENYYSVPHLVLNNVNYGIIDFSELEMDAKRGNVGIIGDPSEIDVNQSRESVRYTEKTRNSIKKYLEKSIIVAQNHIESGLEESKNDFLKWVVTCKNLKAKDANDNVFNRLSGLADLSQIEFKFGDTGIIYSQNNFKKVFGGFNITKTIVEERNGIFRTNTTVVHSWADFNPETIFFRSSMSERISPIVMGYISKEITKSNVVYLITPEELPITDLILSDLTSDGLSNIEFLKPILEICNGYKVYDDIEVPDEFLSKHKELQESFEKKVEEEAKVAAMTEKELRKLNGKILVHYFSITNNYSNIHENSIIKKKLEISIDDCNKLSKSNTIYGTSEDIPLMLNLLHIPDDKIYESKNCYKLGTSGKLNFIVVAKDIVKYIDNHATHVSKAIQTIEGTKISVMSKIKEYNTARLFKHVVDSVKYKYLTLFELVDNEAFETYSKLSKFVQSNGFGSKFTGNSSTGQTEIIEYLDSLAKFQLFLIENEGNTEAIALKSKEYFNTPSLNGCDALNLEYYAKFKALEDYIENMKALLSPYSCALNSYNFRFNSEAVREYIQLKGIPNYSEFLKARNEEFKVELQQSTETEILTE